MEAPQAFNQAFSCTLSRTGFGQGHSHRNHGANHDYAGPSHTFVGFCEGNTAGQEHKPSTNQGHNGPGQYIENQQQNHQQEDAHRHITAGAELVDILFKGLRTAGNNQVLIKSL